LVARLTVDAERRRSDGPDAEVSAADRAVNRHLDGVAADV
jgi:hypothetical protein